MKSAYLLIAMMLVVFASGCIENHETDPEILAQGKVCDDSHMQNVVDYYVIHRCVSGYKAVSNSTEVMDLPVNYYDLDGNYIVSCGGLAIAEDPQCDSFGNMTCTSMFKCQTLA